MSCRPGGVGANVYPTRAVQRARVEPLCGDVRDEVVVGNPRQGDIGAQHAHTLDAGVGGGVGSEAGVVQAQYHDVVTRAGQRGRESLDVCGDPADDLRRVLPREHQHVHVPKVAARPA